jgi:FlaA1/EpsC-like NDP-sugar epimerase
MAEFDRRTMLGWAAAAMAGSLAACSQASPSVAPSPATKGRFENKVIAITGATSGIGRAAALAFAAEGGKVGFCGRRELLGRQVEQEIRSRGGEALSIKADVRVEAEVKSFVDQVVLDGGKTAHAG